MAASRFQLDAGKIEETVVTLARRIAERFPQSGLYGVCQHLHSVAAAARKRALEIQRPIVSVRIASALMIAGVLVMLGYTVQATLDLAKETGNKLGPSDFVQMLDAAINSVVLVGATVLFLVTLESRIKRRRALRALHELRAIAHVIDMHQLTKDPERALGIGQDTASSPKRQMTPIALARYLDYCSEMLSLAGKIAAVYAQDLDDPVVVDAVNDIEDLTTGLSRKIWQKISILNAGIVRSTP
ncbi:MAG: hypothetical protein U0992_02840 [Planctomycetaceae bacterium]